MSGSPIPETSGFNYATYAICWPQTDKWEGLLTGFLTLPSMAEFWDEDTGNVDDIVTVGEQILDFNLDVAQSEIGEGCQKNMIVPEVRYTQTEVNFNSTGTNTVTVATVPSGEQWIVHAAELLPNGGEGEVIIVAARSPSIFIRYAEFPNDHDPVPLMMPIPSGGDIRLHANVTTPIFSKIVRLAILVYPEPG